MSSGADNSAEQENVAFALRPSAATFNLWGE